MSLLYAVKHRWLLFILYWTSFNTHSTLLIWRCNKVFKKNLCVFPRCWFWSSAVKYFKTINSFLEGYYLPIWYAVLSLVCVCVCKCSLKPCLRLYTKVHGLQMWLITCCVHRYTLHLWLTAQTPHDKMQKNGSNCWSPCKVFDVTIYDCGNI